MGFLLKIFSGLGPKLAGIAALIGAVFLWGASKKREGRKQAENTQLKKTHEIKSKQDKVKRPKDVDDTLDRL